MIWVVANLCIFAIGSGVTLYLVKSERGRVENAHHVNLERVAAEKTAKSELLGKLALTLTGMVSERDFDDAARKFEELEGQLNAETGKIAITEAELDSLDIRLRELEELKRELEASNLDAIKEVEMLRAQQRDLSNQNEAIGKQLKSSLDQIDILLSMLSNNDEAVAQLEKSKEEMIQVESSISFYEQEITKINEQYIGLKKAYDALDIEYAQLYEKRQMQLEGGDY